MKRTIWEGLLKYSLLPNNSSYSTKNTTTLRCKFMTISTLPNNTPFFKNPPILLKFFTITILTLPQLPKI